MTWWVLLGGIGLVLTAGCCAARNRLGRERGYQRAIQLFRTTNPDQRADGLRSLLRDSRAKGPAWYLLGCLHLRAGDVREAARAFGMAYHGDDKMESAVLLTFACLKAGNDRRSDLLSHALNTWREMKEPGLPRTTEDRILLACLEAEIQRPPLSPPPARLIRAILEQPRA